MKLKERERRVQELEGRLDTIIIVVSFIVIIIIVITIVIIIVIIVAITNTMVRLKDDQLMGRIREAEHSQQVTIVIL